MQQLPYCWNEQQREQQQDGFFVGAQAREVAEVAGLRVEEEGDAGHVKQCGKQQVFDARRVEYPYRVEGGENGGKVDTQGEAFAPGDLQQVGADEEVRHEDHRGRDFQQGAVAVAGQLYEQQANLDGQAGEKQRVVRHAARVLREEGFGEGAVFGTVVGCTSIE